VSRESFTSSYVTATQSINREDVAMKVMDALEPTIAAQVARAIESLRSTQIAQLRAQVTVSESQKESLVQQIIVTLTPTIRSAVHSAMESQASARLSSLVSQVSTPDQATVTAQILAALRPQVVAAVNTAASAQEAAQRGVPASARRGALGIPDCWWRRPGRRLPMKAMLRGQRRRMNGKQ